MQGAVPELMTVDQVAQRLAVSKKRVYQLVNCGRLDSLKLSPRSTRITRASVEAFVEQRLCQQRRDLGLDAQ